MKQYEIITIIMSGLALLGSSISIFFVFSQVKGMMKQLFLDNYTRISEVNRSLIVLGFSDHDLFSILDGCNIPNNVKQKRYIQLWLNQADIIITAHKLGILNDSSWNALQADLTDFFLLPPVKKRWENVKQYYNKDMIVFVDDILKNAE